MQIPLEQVEYDDDDRRLVDKINENFRLLVYLLNTGKLDVGNMVLKSGDIVLLSADGIIQTWQEGRADNVDATHPLTLNIYMPAEVVSIAKALLRFRLLNFRAYETAAASGGADTSGPSNVVTTLSDNGPSQTSWYMTAGGVDFGRYDTNWSFVKGATTGISLGDYLHNHGITNGTHLAVDGGGYVTWVENTHNHSITDLGHAHYVYDFHLVFDDPAHDHGMDHTHTTPNHVHGLTFGIYEGTAATGVTVTINGTDRTAALGGGAGFNADQASLDIAQWLVAGAWNTITLGSTQLGRIDASVFVQAMLGVS